MNYLPSSKDSDSSHCDSDSDSASNSSNSIDAFVLLLNIISGNTVEPIYISKLSDFGLSDSLITESTHCVTPHSSHKYSGGHPISTDWKLTILSSYHINECSDKFNYINKEYVRTLILICPT